MHMRRWRVDCSLSQMFFISFGEGTFSNSLRKGGDDDVPLELRHSFKIK